ncbi:MAG: signal recognition particle-docking protein FtsY, partial [Pseudanabaena sp.]
MVFNWFRRKFDDDKDATNQPVEPAQTEEKTPESVDEPSPIASPASQDLLNWAKAAYANVQQQTDVAEEKTTEAEVTEPEVFETEIVAVTSEIIEPEAGQPEIVQTEIAELEVEQEINAPDVIVTNSQIVELTIVEAISDPTESVTPISDESPLEIFSAPEPVTPVETAPEIETAEVPFWMQSESDRLARIAALEATAIVEPEPEVKPAAQSRRKATIKFDDDFI